MSSAAATMTNDVNPATTKTKRSVAIIGGGVSGLAAAWHLQVNCAETAVHLYESERRVGGHAWTVPVQDSDGFIIDVDIGFMVFNHTNYPNMVQWFRAMQIQEENSDMSFAVSLDHGTTAEWSSCGINSLFSNRNQLWQPSFYSMLTDMIRFNANATDLLLLHDDDPRKHVTVQQYLRDNHYSTAFSTYYLLPMMAALWSASLEDVLQFPAAQLISFLCNHQMLRQLNRPQWKTVAGRSQQYTQTVVQQLSKDAIHLSSPVHSIVQQPENGKYQIFVSTSSSAAPATDGIWYDDVIFACHPPTVIEILQRSTATTATHAVVDLLSQIEYADNLVYVHSDTSLMPAKQRSWASWNCMGKSQYLMDMFVPKKKEEPTKHSGAFEGASSGFGNTLPKSDDDPQQQQHQQQLEGEEGRFKAVYIT